MFVQFRGQTARILTTTETSKAGDNVVGGGYRGIRRDLAEQPMMIAGLVKTVAAVSIPSWVYYSGPVYSVTFMLAVVSVVPPCSLPGRATVNNAGGPVPYSAKSVLKNVNICCRSDRSVITNNLYGGVAYRDVNKHIRFSVLERIKVDTRLGDPGPLRLPYAVASSLFVSCRFLEMHRHTLIC